MPVISSEIKTYNYDDGEIQRVQFVTCSDWNSLDFIYPKISKEAIEHVAGLFRDFFIPSAPYYFGELVIFHIPDEWDFPFTQDGITDRHIIAKNVFSKRFAGKAVREYMKKLEDNGYLYRVKGNNPFMHVYMPYESIGFLSESAKDAKLRVNANFFTFDNLDDDSPYDIFGTPLGLLVKDGKILSPPLFEREALLAGKDGKVLIKKIGLKDLKLSVPGTVYERPEYRKTPLQEGFDAAIVGKRVVFVKRGGGLVIPSSGFALHCDEECLKPGDTVEYTGLEDIAFGIQCGNSIVVDGRVTDHFISKFYHWLRPGEVAYPPGRYPHDFDKDRAPRIALGADSSGRPVVIWAEGASKIKHEIGKDSCGASLREMGEILNREGIVNAVNLDGGGSAQILLDGKRSLQISDRRLFDNEESERPIPLGIFVL